MPIVVMKFGGSSVASVDKIKQVALSIVARWRAGDQVVVVVSAMGKTTEELIAMARQVSSDPPRRELDMLVTSGERISMALLSMAIAVHDVEAVSLTGSQSGIITDEQHQGARILEVRPTRVLQALEKNRVVIVAGFQGVSRTGEVTTLGRGGSDTSAVAMAAALQAASCEIYSDVDGVYTADPALCPQAQLLPHLSYQTMRHLALAGARVLNAEAVRFAEEAGIVIHARKTGDTSGRQTVISYRSQPVTAVVGATQVSLLRGDVLPALDEITAAGGQILFLSSDQAMIDRTGIPGRTDEGLIAIAHKHGIMHERVGVVTVIAHTQTILHRVMASMSYVDQVKWFMASAATITLGVDPARVDEVVRDLHQHLASSPHFVSRLSECTHQPSV